MRKIGTALAFVAVLSTVWVVTACRGGNAADVEDSTPEEKSELVIFVFDRSTSIPDHTLELARDLTAERLGELDHGDRLAAMQLLQLSLAEPPKRWAQQVPDREVERHEIARDSVNRARFIQDARAYLASFSEAEGRDNINGTDILSTLHDVGEELRAYRDHDATLYLFSDMLQSTRVIEMEGLRAMPPAGWIKQARDRGMLPDLTGLCVVVIGARVDTEASQRVKSFWDEYFEATGATLLDENYMLRPVKLPTDPCP